MSSPLETDGTPVGPMTPDMFRRSLDNVEPPRGLDSPLVALWWDRKGDWNRAHAAVQEGATAVDAWVHAYLHRREGDLGNARYWYRIAKKPVAEGSLTSEWEGLLSVLLPMNLGP